MDAARTSPYREAWNTIARAATRPPWHTSRTRSLTKSQARSLLSTPK
jgi:hypothetical protein